MSAASFALPQLTLRPSLCQARAAKYVGFLPVSTTTRAVRRTAFRTPQHLRAVHVRKAQVENHYVDGRTECSDALGSGVSCEDRMPQGDGTATVGLCRALRSDASSPESVGVDPYR